MKELALHILDITQNSIAAGASLILIDVETEVDTDSYKIKIVDNGKGIKNEMIKKVTDSFVTSRSTRKVGLGLPLFKQNAEQAGGWLKIESNIGSGTIVTAMFQNSNIDRPPMGDIAGTICLLVTANPEVDFVYHQKTLKCDYTFDSREIKKILDYVPVSNTEVYMYLKEMIECNIVNFVD
jgi:hypothetical protein